MKMTNKDKDFLENLHCLIQEKELSVDLVDDGLKRMVLRQNYGDKIHKSFGVSRQGVRWRFQRLLNGIYIDAYESIFFVESLIGTELREYALDIARERIQLRRKLPKMEVSGHCRRQTGNRHTK